LGVEPIVDHIQITVADLDLAEPFYDQVLSLLGFDLAHKSRGRVDAHDFDVIEYVHDALVIGINSPRDGLKGEPVHRRRPGALHHLAFRAESPTAVDEFHTQLQRTSALILEPPRFYPQHGESYYAVFFKDPGGIKLEVMHEER
jgi:catechol 2,3-dioxygenase-like lactoylglutathione lyase family enzyme